MPPPSHSFWYPVCAGKLPFPLREGEAHASNENPPAERVGTALPARGPGGPKEASRAGIHILRRERQNEAGKNVRHHLHPGSRKGARSDQRLTRHLQLGGEWTSGCGRLAMVEPGVTALAVAGVDPGSRPGAARGQDWFFNLGLRSVRHDRPAGGSGLRRTNPNSYA